MLHLKKFITLFLITFFSNTWTFTNACSNEVDQSTQVKTSLELYNSAVHLMNKGYYLRAIKIFDEIDMLYPFSEHAVSSNLLAAISSYKISKYDNAILYSENHMKLSTKNRDLSYFIKIMSYYMKIPDISLDQQNTEEAFRLCEEFISIFQKSKYLNQVQIKYSALKNQLAAKEFLIANYYLKNGYYISSINRFNNIFERYSDTRYFKESVFKILESYLALYQIEEAEKYLRYLKPRNSNDSNYWYKKSLNLILKIRKNHNEEKKKK